MQSSKWLNQSYDAATKSVNSLNYAGAAYMSVPGSQINTNTKLSKVHLKNNHASASRQSSMHPPANYSDGSGMMINMSNVRASSSSQAGMNTANTVVGGVTSHKQLYMSQQERMQEIGKAYNYSTEQAMSAANIKIQNAKKQGVNTGVVGGQS